MDFLFYILFNINISILGLVEAYQLKLYSFGISFSLNIHLILCEYIKKNFQSNFNNESKVLLVYICLFTYFPFLLVHIFSIRSLYHTFVFSHWMYQYITCPIFHAQDSKHFLLEKEPQCSICFEKMHECITLPCNHSFHDKCITMWFKAQSSIINFTCPLCRKPIYKISSSSLLSSSDSYSSSTFTPVSTPRSASEYES